MERLFRVWSEVDNVGRGHCKHSECRDALAVLLCGVYLKRAYAPEVLSLLSIAMITIMTESSLGRMGLFNPILCSPSSKEVKAGSDAEAMKEFYLMPCSLWLA